MKTRPPVEATLFLVGEVYTPRRRFRPGGLVVQGGKVWFAGPASEARRWVAGLHDRSPSFALDILEFPRLAAGPGFVDVHLHGGNGADVMDGRPEAVAAALAPHLRDGTTSVLATVMTAAHEEMMAAIRAVRRTAKDSFPIPDILGLHLEGPYLVPEKAGAQPAAHVRPFSAGELAAYLEAAEGTIRVATLAPERAGAGRMIAFLRRRGVVAAAGHSNASYAQARKAVELGVRHGTHLFNAMSGIFHRDPGLARALLLEDRVSVELIADGLHLHPAILELVLRLKPWSKVILASDATRRAGLSGRPLRTAEGRLYGSSITLGRAVRNLAAWTRLPRGEVLAMATENPAKLAGGYPRKGRLGRGADADIVLLDRNNEVRKVYLRGKEIK
jgi:N-acetylglucosamine-6-phosphate deacetylase